MISIEDKITTTVNSILYILQNIGGKGDFHKIFKVLYFADQKHLTRYGTLITDDKYVAMNNGPVPSMAYDILKALRGEGLLAKSKDQFTPYFELQTKYLVKAKAEPDMDDLSMSEIACINESIEENKELDFLKLTDKSHDNAWKSATQDCEMDLAEIAKAGGANSDMIKYILESLENQNAIFA